MWFQNRQFLHLKLLWRKLGDICRGQICRISMKLASNRETTIFQDKKCQVVKSTWLRTCGIPQLFMACHMGYTQENHLGTIGTPTDPFMNRNHLVPTPRIHSDIPCPLDSLVAPPVFSFLGDTQKKPDQHITLDCTTRSLFFFIEIGFRCSVIDTPG